MKDILLDRAKDAIVRQELETALTERKLRVKLGIDPTGPRLHIGRTSTLRRVRALQDMGHQIVLIIGDFTAKIGDSSDKTAERQVLTDKQIAENMKGYLEQIGKVIDVDKAEIHYNSEWLSKLGPDKFLELAQQFTVAQMIERDNFKDRYAEQRPIGMHEFLYPMLQGYDSVMVKADLELGGTDQLFNLMAGRTIQKQYGQKPQFVMTFDLLEGTDGRKMSTSWGNTIYADDEPTDMYGKIMSINDDMIAHYYRVCTDIEAGAIDAMVADIAGGANPRDSKASLAREVVRLYHGEDAALAAEDAWKAQFQQGQRPADIPVQEVTKTEWNVVELLVSLELAASNSEARRLIQQGGVRYDDAVLAPDAPLTIANGGVVQVGKRRFVEIKVTS